MRFEKACRTITTCKAQANCGWHARSFQRRAWSANGADKPHALLEAPYRFRSHARVPQISRPSSAAADEPPAS
jgi:hypothetical protein